MQSMHYLLTNFTKCSQKH